MRIVLDGGTLHDHEGFHDVFARAFGFPAFYGRNMDAWIDCMSCLRAPESGLSAVQLLPGEVLELVVQRGSELRALSPRVWQDLIECTAFVNARYRERGESDAIQLIMQGEPPAAAT